MSPLLRASAAFVTFGTSIMLHLLQLHLLQLLIVWFVCDGSLTLFLLQEPWCLRT